MIMGLLQRTIALVAIALAAPLVAQKSHDAGWPEWGGTLAGQRYSSADQINTFNVTQLKQAWVFHTHALNEPSNIIWRTLFEATPVLWNGKLYFNSPFNQVYAVDAETGAQSWKFDPQIPRNDTAYMVVNRGVALWHAKNAARGTCNTDRVFTATLDRRLIALDAKTGIPCAGFGQKGTVDLGKGLTLTQPYMYFFSSPPVVVGDVVIVGSAIGDNQTVFEASGVVRGFDVITGALRWSWEPLPWAQQQHPPKSGSGNVWSIPSADPEHDLVFLPTGSASVDFYGGLRPGDNRDADSIVAVRASTGQKVWSYQLVHHDLWDYDTPSQPTLFMFRGSIPALAVTTKTNMIFVFNRLTGEPLYPIEERPVAQSTVHGETTWPTQPFSSLPFLGPMGLNPKDIHLANKEDEKFCRSVAEEVDNKGLFTPPSLRGAIENPGNAGGSNWGSSAFDPATSILYSHTTNMPYLIRLNSRAWSGETATERFERRLRKRLPTWLGGDPLPPKVSLAAPPDKGGSFDDDPMLGTPFSIQRGALKTPSGEFCATGPYGSIVATNLATGKQLWSVPLGQFSPTKPGEPGNSGVIATAGGLLFAGSGGGQPYLYAFSSKTGESLWKGLLPAASMANPMTYTLHGRQFVVIAAARNGAASNAEADTIVAFALPKNSLKTKLRAR